MNIYCFVNTLKLIGSLTVTENVPTKEPRIRRWKDKRKDERAKEQTKERMKERTKERKERKEINREGEKEAKEKENKGRKQRKGKGNERGRKGEREVKETMWKEQKNENNGNTLKTEKIIIDHLTKQIQHTINITMLTEVSSFQEWNANTSICGSSGSYYSKSWALE